MAVTDTWYSKIESTILTYLDYELSSRVGAPYPDMNCTTSSQAESIPDITVFPTLYVHDLEPIEIGGDLEGYSVNAIRSSIEIQVFSNESENHCKEIMTSAIQVMKALRYRVTMFPNPRTNNKVYYAIARFTRVIGSGDSDIVSQE